MLCKGCSLVHCIKAGCKTDMYKEAQKAALCLLVMTLRVQLVPGAHHGITLTCRVQGHTFSCQATAHSHTCIPSQPSFSSTLKQFLPSMNCIAVAVAGAIRRVHITGPALTV